MLVQALVAEPAVEAFDKAILLRLARRDVALQHSLLLLPLQDGVRRRLRAVIADDHHRSAAPPLDDPVQFAPDPAANP